MKSILIQYKVFFIFLIKFLGFYLGFALLYSVYLNQFNTQLNEVDHITRLVAEQTNSFLHIFNQNSRIEPNDADPSVKMIFNDVFVARIIEGCNSISVIILFAAFIFAFATHWKTTLLYIIIGSIVIYILNIVRIALLTYAIGRFPHYQELLHTTIFPLFIYGVVFLLWVIWVKRFSGYDTLDTKKQD